MTEPTGLLVDTPQNPIKSLKTYAEEANLKLDFDPDAIVKKYDEERERRLRPDNISQYNTTRSSDYFKSFLTDLYARPDFNRNPVKAKYEVVVIGAGYTGIGLVASLREKGITDVCVIEKGDGVGGTWYWNRYPGVQCDIESYIYMPMLESVNYFPSLKYAYGYEIRAHAEALAKKYDVYSKTLFQTEAVKLSWNDECGLWRVETSRDDDIQAKWIIPAPGPFQLPKFPGIPGIESFKGKTFHSCRWDWKYSGGTPEQPDLTGLADKRVGIIGTGATGVQLVPRLAEWAKELYVFQRTPSSIDYRNNRSTDEEWARSLKPGWQEARQVNFTTLVNGGHAEEDLVNDGWTDVLRNLPGFLGGGESIEDPGAMKAKMQLADLQKMQSIRSRVDASVKDPKTREALKPWYNQFCKRPCFHDEYLQAFNKANVHLIDTEGKGVEQVYDKGLVANGTKYELDCVIYATGFEWATDFSARAGAQIYGRGGVSLSEKFKDGVTTFHGWGVNGFPNMGLVSIHQSGSSPNWTHNSFEMNKHIVHIITEARVSSIKELEPTQEAADAWVEECIKAGGARIEFLRSCTPGYYGDEGKIDNKLTKSQPFLAGGSTFFRILDNWRKEGKLKGLDIKYGQSSATP
ncbi:hypothetical protein H2204_013993 [Knufia peltigerae]|uniref:FAD/NAD(P)-binding domain-containing protein n=1 Tax=Knufia peltigerae TaxID=1002370 RepID=A0AA38XMF1_9EURO|nr:hypothetical protein H2204_013993 [Knufia peltigerae]